MDEASPATEPTVTEPKIRGKGISSFIKEKFYGLQEGQALSFDGLVGELRNTFPHIKNGTSASARINLVLKQKKVSQDFKKYVQVVPAEKTESKKEEKVLWIVPKTDIEREFDTQVANAKKEEKKAAKAAAKAEKISDVSSGSSETESPAVEEAAPEAPAETAEPKATE